VKDDRPFGGSDPPAAMFYYSRDRSGEHPQAHLASYTGILQADAFGGYIKLYEPERSPGLIREAACWVHARRPFFAMADLEENARRKAAGKKEIVISPVAMEIVRRIDALFEIERSINGQNADQRKVVRQAQSAPLVADLEAYMREQCAKLSRGHDLAKAMNYMFKRWASFTRFLDDGRVCLSNNAAERALRGIAICESLYIPSSSVCKHWNRVVVADATRAPLSRDRGFDGVAREVDRTDLEWRTPQHLFGSQHAGLYQTPDHVTAHAEMLRSLGQRQPFAVLFRRPVGMDATYTANGRHAVRRPGFALAGR
jgi:hypothetical protein